jgi:hypothetical protein
MNRCVYPKCVERIRGRGLCNAHYKQANRLIKAGKASEADLVKRGLLLPSKKAKAETDAKAFLKGSAVVGKKASKVKRTKTKKKTNRRRSA